MIFALPIQTLKIAEPIKNNFKINTRHVQYIAQINPKKRQNNIMNAVKQSKSSIKRKMENTFKNLYD